MGSILAFQLETDKRKQIKEIETRGERDVTEGKGRERWDMAPRMREYKFRKRDARPVEEVEGLNYDGEE